MLYKSIRLINYKAFDDITFSLTSKNKTPKNLAIIYGGNGSGKSTILESFSTLHDLTHTMDITNTLDIFKEKLNQYQNINTDDINEFTKYISRGYTSVSKIYDKIKGTSIDAPTIIILEFEENGYSGSFEIHLQNKRIVFEELKYLISKNKGCYYKITENNIYINDKTILDAKVIKDLKEMLIQSWGVHSCFSIIKNLLKKYNIEFIENAFKTNFIDILNSFDKFSFRICNLSNTVEGLSKTNSYLLSHLSNGYVEKTSLEELESTAKILTALLKNIISDLINVEYTTQDSSYYLILNKRINNKNIKINYKYESSGIKEIINIFPYFLKAINGENVVLDEYANHIHDSISAVFLQAITPLIKGQIIISTHSTVLLNTALDNSIESFYFVNVNNSIRDIKCITDIETRIRKDYNYQKKYLYDESYRYFRNEQDNSKNIILSAEINSLIDLFKKNM